MLHGLHSADFFHSGAVERSDRKPNRSAKKTYNLEGNGSAGVLLDDVSCAFAPFPFSLGDVLRNFAGRWIPFHPSGSFPSGSHRIRAGRA